MLICVPCTFMFPFSCFKPRWVGAPLGDLTAEAQVPSALGPLNLPRVYSTSSPLTLRLGGGRRQPLLKNTRDRLAFPKTEATMSFIPHLLLQCDLYTSPLSSGVYVPFV